MDTEELKANPVCAVGSVFAAIVLLAIFLVVSASILFSLGISTKGWPHVPRVIGWICDAYTVGFVAVKLYPKCMKARLARRFAHG